MCAKIAVNPRDCQRDGAEISRVAQHASEEKLWADPPRRDDAGADVEEIAGGGQHAACAALGRGTWEFHSCNDLGGGG